MGCVAAGVYRLTTRKAHGEFVGHARPLLKFQQPYATILQCGNGRRGRPGRLEAMKFSTLIPTTRNDGTTVKPSVMDRALDSLWRPFRGMTDEGEITGHWIDDDGTEFTDICIKVSIKCDRARLQEAIRAVRLAGRKLGQKAMYFEVSGYDGVQILASIPKEPLDHERIA